MKPWYWTVACWGFFCLLFSARLLFADCLVPQTLAAKAYLSPYKIAMARQEAIPFKADHTLNIAKISGSGIITTIWLALEGDHLYLDSLVQVYVDHEDSPSISFDVGSLGLHSLSAQNPARNFHTRNVYVAAQGNTSTLTLRFLIPFSTAVRVDIQNPSASSGTLWSQVFYTTDTTLPLRLKSLSRTWANKATVASGSSHTFADITHTQGWLVWHSLVMSGATNRSFMESDVNLYLDGETTPSIASTGTEDWFTSAFYFVVGPHSTPWWFVSVVMNNDTVAAIDLLEALGGIKFNTSLKVLWDGSESSTHTDISYVLLYYRATG